MDRLYTYNSAFRLRYSYYPTSFLTSLLRSINIAIRSIFIQFITTELEPFKYTREKAYVELNPVICSASSSSSWGDEQLREQRADGWGKGPELRVELASLSICLMIKNMADQLLRSHFQRNEKYSSAYRVPEML